jgi:hypothetical protein
LPRLAGLPEFVEDVALGESHGAAELLDVQRLDGVEDELVGGGRWGEAVIDADDGAVLGGAGCHGVVSSLMRLVRWVVRWSVGGGGGGMCGLFVDAGSRNSEVRGSSLCYIIKSSRTSHLLI